LLLLPRSERVPGVYVRLGASQEGNVRG